MAAFQEDHGLEVDGIAGRMTLAALDEAVYGSKDSDQPAVAQDPAPTAFWLPDLKAGDSGPAVEFLQAALKIRGRDLRSEDPGRDKPV